MQSPAALQPAWTGRVSELLARAAAMLRDAGIEGARLEARSMLAHLLGLDQAGLLRDSALVVSLPALGPMLARRAVREPLALILGRREFWSLEFEVADSTLVPRPDSETLVEAVLAARPAAQGRVARVLDLGTGTGCLLLATLSEYPAAFGIGVDRSPAAAALAARNAARLGLGGRSAMLAGDWNTALAGRFDVVLSNPPYIPSADIAGLMPEVAAWEPGSALDGGADGLVAYRRIVAALPALLAPGGLAVLELGIGQAPDVIALAHAAGFTQAATRADLGGIDRALVIAAA